MREVIEIRRHETIRFWLYVAITLISIGIAYGKIAGRLDLIEYRIGQIEMRVSK